MITLVAAEQLWKALQFFSAHKFALRPRTQIATLRRAEQDLNGNRLTKKRGQMYKNPCASRDVPYTCRLVLKNTPTAIIATVFHLLAGSYLILLSARSRIPAIVLRFPIRNQNLYFTNTLSLVQKECTRVCFGKDLSAFFIVLSWQSVSIARSNVQSRERELKTKQTFYFKVRFHSRISPAPYSILKSLLSAASGVCLILDSFITQSKRDDSQL